MCNRDNAQEALDEYHNNIGGQPEPPAKKGGKGKRSASAIDSPSVETSSKKACGGRKFDVNGTPSKMELPSGSWETHIKRVSSILEEDEEKGKRRQLIGLVEWEDSRKTQHKMEVLRRKCPQKLLNYYEQHL